MRSLPILGLIALAAGSPTAVVPRSSSVTTTTVAFYDLVGTATAVATPNGAPVIGSTAELINYDADAAAAAVAARVTGVATPIAKRDVGVSLGLGLCVDVLGIQIPPGCASSAGQQHTATAAGTTGKVTTTWPTSSSGHCKTQTSAALTTSTPTSTPASVYVSVPTTCTPVSWTNTNTYTSVTACSTAIEVGTYCGFINPEDPCASQLAGSAPSPTADTVSAFLANPAYQSLASKAATPSGYASTFTDLTAAVSGNTYLGYKTLSSYDTASCAAFCDATDLCTGFNIYVERDPGWNPDQCSCADPPSTYNYKCSIFAGGVYAAAATNDGQYRDDFEVAITASNGYMASNATTGSSGDGVCLPSGCTQQHSCWGKTHQHPETCVKEAFFPGAFDIDLCIHLAVSQSGVNLAADVDASVAFLNAAMISRDGEGWGTWCGLFTETYTSADCTWSPGPSGGHNWGCEDSWGIDIDVNLFLGL